MQYIIIVVMTSGLGISGKNQEKELVFEVGIENFQKYFLNFKNVILGYSVY